ncbi:2-hydroxyacid dehydrogenase [Salinimicrobium catena]|uniref:2-hydroxyacid dehydrogenase n=1 Tax=Salinimicrobium catena TaxID=390640 RepID=UPI002FE437A6
MKVAVFSSKSYDREYLNRFNNERHELVFFDAALNSHTTSLSLGYEAVCVFVNDKLDPETIKQLQENGVRLIALRCAGFNNVDLPSAEDKGIKVVRVPAYSPHAVAEHAVALILSLSRKIHKAYNRIREGNFSLEKLVGFNLFGKTVGVVGTGQIGAIFCEIMLGFGCRVLAYDPRESDALKQKGVEYCTFDELVRQADIISLNCPLTPETYHLLDKNVFDRIKKGTMIINTGRGAVIKTSDAIDALRSGKLGYLGIDVYEQEENLFFRDLSESIIPDEQILQLITFPNVLITSHQGFFTHEALEEIAATTIKNLSDFEEGRTLENEVRIKKS